MYYHDSTCTWVFLRRGYALGREWLLLQDRDMFLSFEGGVFVVMVGSDFHCWSWYL